MTQKMPTKSRPSPREIARSIPLGDLLSLGLQLNADVTPATLFQEVAEAITHVLGFRRAHIRLRNVETDELEAVAFAGLSEQEQADLRAYAVAPSSYQALLQERFRNSNTYYIPFAAGVEVEPALTRGFAAASPGWRSGQWHPGDFLLVPLRGRGDRLLGVIYLNAPADRQIPREMTLSMLDAIARQAALSLENARLYARTARLLSKEQLLAELGRDISTTLELPAILARIAARLGMAFHGGTLALLDDQGNLSVLATINQNSDSALPGLSTIEQRICDQVVTLAAPYLSNDIDAEGLLAVEEGSLQGLLFHSYIAVPLRAGGRVIGVLTVNHPQPGGFTYEDVDLLEAVASQIGGPIASARLYQELQRRSAQLAALNEVGSQIAAILDLDDLLWTVVRLIRDHFSYQNVTLALIEDDRLVFKANLNHYQGDERRELGCSFGVGEEGVMGWVAEAGEPLLVPDVRVEPRYIPDPAMLEVRSELCVPLRRGGRILGVLDVQSERPSAFDAADLAVLQALADLVASAILNAQLYQQERRRVAQWRALNESNAALTATLDLDQVLQRILEQLQGVVALDSASIFLLEGESLKWIAGCGFERPLHGLTFSATVDPIANKALRGERPLVLTNAQLELDFADSPGGRIRSWIGVPLRAKDRLIGLLTVDSHTPNRYTEQDGALVATFARQAALAVENARLYQEAHQRAIAEQRRADQLTVLNAVARVASSTLELDRLLSQVTFEIRHGFGYDNVQLFLVDEESQHLSLATQAGEALGEIDTVQLSISEGLMGRAARSGQTVRVDDVVHDPDFVPSPLADTRSELCVPVKAAGRVLAVLNLESSRLAAFTQDDVSVLETAADVLAGAIENIRLYRRSQEAAVLEERTRLARDLHDSVTQQLFSIALTAQAARAQIEKRPDRATSQMERLQETAAAALAEMRGLIFQLRPPAALERGLVPALQQHIAAVRRRDGLPIELKVEGEGRLPHRAEQGLYRIVQEALNNVARHAGECYVVVTVVFKPESVCVEIEDTGCGFDPKLIQARSEDSGGRRLGLTGMRERAAELGADLRISSQVGVGTHVVVELNRA